MGRNTEQELVKLHDEGIRIHQSGKYELIPFQHRIVALQRDSLFEETGHMLDSFVLFYFSLLRDVYAQL